MAHRDKSQGFGFVYFDLSTLIGNKTGIADAQNSVDTGSFTVPALNFPKAENFGFGKEDPKNTPVEKKDVQDKLDRLQSLHHKLHVMLEEVDKLTKKKK